MAENQAVDSGQEGQEQQQEQVEKQPSKYEQQALGMGWRPQEEWEGEAEDFVSAKEFVQRKSFFEKISTQSKKIKDLEDSITHFKDHYQKMEEFSRKRVLDELKTRKKAALEDGDPDAVIEIDEAIADFKIQEKEIKEKQEKAEQQKRNVDPAPLVEWKTRNEWFDRDQEMTRYANRLAYGYRAEDPDRDPADILKEIERDVRKMFPDKFKNVARNKATAVEPSSNGKSSASNNSKKYDPSDEERAIARKFVKMGMFKSEDAYYEDLKKLKGVE